MIEAHAIAHKYFIFRFIFFFLPFDDCSIASIKRKSWGSNTVLFQIYTYNVANFLKHALYDCLLYWYIVFVYSLFFLFTPLFLIHLKYFNSISCGNRTKSVSHRNMCATSNTIYSCTLTRKMYANQNYFSYNLNTVGTYCCVNS